MNKDIYQKLTSFKHCMDPPSPLTALILASRLQLPLASIALQALEAAAFVNVLVHRF